MNCTALSDNDDHVCCALPDHGRSGDDGNGEVAVCRAAASCVALGGTYPLDNEDCSSTSSTDKNCLAEGAVCCARWEDGDRVVSCLPQEDCQAMQLATFRPMVDMRTTGATTTMTGATTTTTGATMATTTTAAARVITTAAAVQLNNYACETSSGVKQNCVTNATTGVCCGRWLFVERSEAGFEYDMQCAPESTCAGEVRVLCSGVLKGP
jgi:hypothetical protein